MADGDVAVHAPGGIGIVLPRAGAGVDRLPPLVRMDAFPAFPFRRPHRSETERLLQFRAVRVISNGGAMLRGPMAALDGDGIARLHGSRSIHEGISGEAASFTFPWPVPAGFPAWRTGHRAYPHPIMS